MEKEYSNGEITVVWNAKKCQHSGICVATLPQVYQPGKKPWINLENSTTEALQAQIDRCPSGALSYRMSEEK